jgi:hypothetical protein
MSQQAFKDALTKLATDAAFRAQATTDPAKVVEAFPALSREEIRALAQAGRVAGASMTKVDDIFGKPVERVTEDIEGGGTSVSVSCCCCCCCGTEGLILHA